MAYRSRIVILLTACVDPMKFRPDKYHKLYDIRVRLAQYIDAIKYYYEQTNLPIVLVENSGFDLSKEPLIDIFFKSGRLEILTYLASKKVRSMGKSYGDMDIIRYAVEKSSFIQNSDYILKITGRLKNLNVNDIIRQIHIYDLKNRFRWIKRKYVVGEKLYRGKWIQGYCFMAHKDFFSEHFFKTMKYLLDSEGNYKLFEEGLYVTVKDWLTIDRCVFRNIYTPMLMDGMRGEGGWYLARYSLRDRTKCAIETIRCNILNKYIEK